jgi:hypothetical protein
MPRVGQTFGVADRGGGLLIGGWFCRPFTEFLFLGADLGKTVFSSLPGKRGVHNGEFLNTSSVGVAN